MKRKLNVLFITIVPSPYQRDLFGALAARGDVDLSVCYLEASSPDSPWPEKPLRPFERILPGFWIPFGNARGHINWNLPNPSEPDIIVVSTFTSLTGQLLMRGRLRNRPWLFWGERLHQNVGFKDFIQRRLAAPISRSAGVVGIGKAAENDYRKRFPHLPHFCIPYHCDLSEFFAIPRQFEDGTPKTFLFCGQMIRRKGVDLLIIAFERLLESGLDARLLLVGRDEELQHFIELASPAAREKIEYAGFQPPENLPSYFSKADVFVLPSRHDGWGVVVNQAMAAGLPVITSNAVGAGLDLIQDGFNGLQVPANDANALFGAMRTVAAIPGLAFQWGQKSRETARDLTPQAGAEKWRRVFDELV